jgi:hypothetical protein
VCSQSREASVWKPEKAAGVTTYTPSPWGRDLEKLFAQQIKKHTGSVRTEPAWGCRENWTLWHLIDPSGQLGDTSSHQTAIRQDNRCLPTVHKGYGPQKTRVITAVQVFVLAVLITISNSRRSRGSSVGIVSDYRLDNRGSISGTGKGFFL